MHSACFFYSFFKASRLFQSYCFVAIFSVIAGSGIKAAEASPVPLSYDQAVRLAVENDPRLLVFEAGIEAAEADAVQAGTRLNPVVGLEVENVLGSGSYRGFDSAEITLGLSQTIETANKREKRAALARTMSDLVAWEREERLVQLRMAVRREFVAALLARESLALQEEHLELVEESARETDRLVKSTRVSQVDSMRARLAVKQQVFIVERGRREVEAAKVRLAALFGPGVSAAFEPVGEIQLEAEVPKLEALLPLLDKTVALARFEAETSRREAALDHERALARQNFEIFAGARYLKEMGDGALVAGIDIPWPLFNQNKGAIRAAETRLRSVDYERAALRRDQRLRLTALYRELIAGHAEARATWDDLMPAAQETLAGVQEGHRRGQFSQLRVLEAREVLFEIRSTYFSALARFAVAQAEIESITMPASRAAP